MNGVANFLSAIEFLCSFFFQSFDASRYSESVEVGTGCWRCAKLPLYSEEVKILVWFLDFNVVDPGQIVSDIYT